jgi:hypothetical protein
MSSPSRPSPSCGVVAALACVTVLVAVLSGCGGSDSLSGTLRTADAQGGHGAPMANGWIAVLTADQASDFWLRAGISSPGAGDLAFVEGRVRHEGVADVGGTLVPVDDKGKFTTTVTGRRQLCVLRELPQVDLIRGCASVDLPADGTLDITVGDNGVQAKLHD